MQWDDRDEGTGTYTGDVRVSAWRYTGGSLSAEFSGDDSGYTSPRSFSVSAGDTVYVKVEGYSNTSSGAYAVRYY